jgi:hypothetical protein
MHRRDFTLDAALAILGGTVITISGCGGGGSPTANTPPSNPPGSSPPPQDETAGISDNHGHAAVIRSAEFVAGNAIELDIRGSADHPHTVSLSANDLLSSRAGNRVQKGCSLGLGHVHNVTFNPTNPNDPDGY